MQIFHRESQNVRWREQQVADKRKKREVCGWGGGGEGVAATRRAGTDQVSGGGEVWLLLFSS
jgi:hypothetical protein